MKTESIEIVIDELINVLPKSIQNNFSRRGRLAKLLSYQAQAWYNDRISSVSNMIQELSKDGCKLKFKFIVKNDRSMMIRMTYRNKKTKTIVQSPLF